MEDILLDILERLKNGESVDGKMLENVLRAHNRNRTGNDTHYSKKRLLPFYLKTKEADPERWARWDIDAVLEKRLVALLQMKPRRTASGVATITVLTKPGTCSSACLYCPNDLRMPKSYLAEEPACQRAERNCFDPYLQVASRLRALTQMGHVTDKVELIILGGTWNDYPEAYRIWFVAELFRALNEGASADESSQKRRAFYKQIGISNRKEDLATFVSSTQRAVCNGSLSYNQAATLLYGESNAWKEAAALQKTSLDDLELQQKANETAAHRVVGLVVETRPDAVDCQSLTLLRRLGCTKVQVGIQSLDPHVLELNNRHIEAGTIRESFGLLRVFGFKIHAHFMINLYGSSPDADKRDYLQFVTDPAYLPDEVKLYPCALVAGTGLCAHYANGSWQPYSEDELIEVLAEDTVNTPPFVRISRMIRDISAQDIMAGNKKVNLRQLVERSIEQSDRSISEIRYREIGVEKADPQHLALQDIAYETAVSHEHFLQWTSPTNEIAGFLRLSLPHADYVSNRPGLPVNPGEAMIREVHVYGKVARLHGTGTGAQHLGLGRQLVEEACRIARDGGYRKINVISSVGTREYYRGLGFEDAGLYQQKAL
jgi:elongator complex protein 3